MSTLVIFCSDALDAQGTQGNCPTGYIEVTDSAGFDFDPVMANDVFSYVLALTLSVYFLSFCCGQIIKVVRS